MSDALARFRAAMREEHRLLEQTPPFCALTAPTVALDTYARFLSVMACFYAGLERVLVPALAQHSTVIAHAYQSRMPSLQADLATVATIDAQRVPAPIVPAPMVPAAQLHEADDMLGVLYVIEGSSHGARLLRDTLRMRLAGTSAGFAFLDLLAQQAVVGMPWSALLPQLERRLAQAAPYARIAAAATATFAQLRGIAATLVADDASSKGGEPMYRQVV